MIAVVGGYFACGNDTSSKPDAGTGDGQVADGAGDAVPSDALTDAVSTDAPVGTDTCDQVRTCFIACAGKCTDLPCLLACHNTECMPKGCGSAQTAWGALFGCLATQCQAQCTNTTADAWDTACQDCGKKNCAAQTTACDNDACK